MRKKIITLVLVTSFSFICTAKHSSAEGKDITCPHGCSQTFKRALSYYGKGEIQEAMKLFKLASEEGSPEAQTMLAMAYLEGKYIKQDYRHC